MNENFCAEIDTKGYSAQSQNLSIPTAEFATDSNKTSSHELLLQKAGLGSLYYKLSLQYAPSWYLIGSLSILTAPAWV